MHDDDSVAPRGGVAIASWWFHAWVICTSPSPTPRPLPITKWSANGSVSPGSPVPLGPRVAASPAAVRLWWT